MKRILTFLLALTMLLSLAACGAAPSPLPLAAVRSRSALSGASLSWPADTEYFIQPFTCTVKSTRSGGAIYLRPRPQKESVTLGTVRDGTEVSILAERGDWYFFETPNGKYGWNSKNFFVLSYIPDGVGSYSAISTRGVRLQRPAANEYYRSGEDGYVNGGDDGWIYILPTPRSGNGNLGILAGGTYVTVLAESGGMYYFETEDGKAGWNSKSSFLVGSQIGDGLWEGFAFPETYTPYGTAYYDYHLNGTIYSEDEIHRLIVDTYYSRVNKETNKYNTGYSSARDRNNRYGYDFGFYYGDDILYYAEARSGSPLKIQVKLYFDFNGNIIGCRDYRGSDSSLYKSGSSKCAQIAREFSYVYSLAEK